MRKRTHNLPGYFWVEADNGVSAIEFAFLAPAFLLILMGIMAYGIYFSAALSVQQLTADAARAAVAGLNSSERSTLVADYVDNNAQKYSFIETKDMKESVTDSKVDKDEFIVQINYDATQLPIWNLFKPLPLPGKTISRSTTIRMGGF